MLSTVLQWESATHPFAKGREKDGQPGLPWVKGGPAPARTEKAWDSSQEGLATCFYSGVGDGNRKHPETATKELTGAQMTILRIVST